MQRLLTPFVIVVAVHAGAVFCADTPGAYADGVTAVTEDGRRVVLLPDGTWRRAERSAATQPEIKESRAAVVDEVCRYTYDFYYLAFNKEARSGDPVRAQLDCLAVADRYARDELIVNDVVQLLRRGRITPESYRRVLANSMQFACVRNTTATRPFSYDEYKLSQCAQLTDGRTTH